MTDAASPNDSAAGPDSSHTAVPAFAPARGVAMPFEMLVKSLAAIAALFYVVGFFTTNSYLYLLGVSDFSLLRTRFILTGVLTLTPLVLALMGGIYAAVDMAAHRDDAGLTSRAYLWILVDIALPFTLYFALFSIVAENDPVASARDAALLSATCAVIVLIVLATVALYRQSGRRPLSHLASRRKPFSYERFHTRFGIPEAIVESLIFAVGGFVLFLLYLGIFGQYFYPSLPEQLGGGRPRNAQLLIAAEAIPAARELGLDVSEESPLSPPVELLWEGEDSYVIRLPRPHHRSVVQLARGLVDGVVTGEALEVPEDAQ